MISNPIQPGASAIRASLKCNMLCMLFLFIGQTQSIGAENSTNPPCPPGKDTTYTTCPLYDYYWVVLGSFDLPTDGTWEPPLQDTSVYNSCDDASSIYIYQRDYPGCPPVQDTARFELLWDPCAWELENVCYTEDSIFFTIPAYPGEHEASTYWFNWHFPGDTFNLDTSYDLSVLSQSDHHSYDLHVFLDESPYCWWTFGEILASDFYGASTDVPCIGSEPPCPTGKDTTLVMCPFKGYASDLLQLKGLPLNGVWEPSLQPWEGYYNSCVDSSSVYIYTNSVPGCPDVQDTVRFNLKWKPPCNWEYEACYTTDRYEITIPAYPEFSGDSYLVGFYAGAGSPFINEYTHCGYWTLNPDSSNTISCLPGWDNDDYTSFCVDFGLTEPTSGCQWYFPPFEYAYEYWDCDLVPCDAVAVEPVSTFEPIRVYPVPTDDVLFIDIEKPITEVLISGADGRLFKQITHPGSNQIWVADLEPGWYLLSIFDGHHWYQARMVK